LAPIDALRHSLSGQRQYEEAEKEQMTHTATVRRATTARGRD
jgi:hypothetical protein